MIEKNDWRLQGQEDYLMDAKLHYVRLEPYSEEWEHEHCEFCWEKFSQDGEFLKEGYCTASKIAISSPSPKPLKLAL